MKLEQLTPNAAIRGILPDALAIVVSVQWFGTEALELTYKNSAGKVANILLYRHDEPRLELVEKGRPWSFDGDGALFRLVSEAHRIHLAHLFDPVLAVHTSIVEPLPHQITAVYQAMLPRQPLRFLLADDPGAGKTIMAGLFIKELIARGDLQRCLIVCPGSLAEQWQDELYRRFHLTFEILTNDKLEAACTGNWFLETNLVIARLDKLSRNEQIQKKLEAPDCRWDLVVCDEAHKMSASFFGGEIKYTKRYRLGQLLSTLTRHFLLMSATPHNGKEEDFQLFMALLDGDRFEGRFRDGVHASDVSDLMRRMVKENLLKFDGTPLFPERIAYTVPYKLSGSEAQLYKEVTNYVREEFNRAEALENDKRAGTVGFALTILQRRLASSPEAIYQSLRRRRERLESRLREMELLQRAASPGVLPSRDIVLDGEDIDDLEEAPDDEVESAEEEILDQATAARTIHELKAEIEILKSLEALALTVRRSGTDTKWRELASLLGVIFTSAAIANRLDSPLAAYGSGTIPPPVASPHQKLVLFTEHRDTLNYLENNIATLLGRRDALVTIHGGKGREERMKAQEAFRHDPQIQILLATDAAGEGINLQRAHLMVNYDLPWNPNRLEQRFGRIHRIGQTEVCHLWNLVAEETREGDVYRNLLEKIEQARKALGGQVFDVLGKLQFEGKSLRDLLIQAIRYGDQPEVRARLTTVIDQALDQGLIQDLLDDRALVHDAMDVARVQRIREEMERAEARRLQPHYIDSFFQEAFRRLGGTAKQREPRRYEITHVPAPVSQRDRMIGFGEPVLPRYERIAFEKDLISPPGQPPAAFLCPGHPLLDAVIDLTLERHRDLLKRGAILVDDRDPGTQPRVLFYLEHAIQDAALTGSGSQRVVSRQMFYIEMSPESPGSAGVPPARGKQIPENKQNPENKQIDNLQDNLKTDLQYPTHPIQSESSASSNPAPYAPIPRSSNTPWHSRGYLPHIDLPGRIQSVTFRLHDAVPMKILEQWRSELNWIQGLPAKDPREIELRKRLDQYEDAGHGDCWLRDERIAALMEKALLHFDGTRYRLLAWCIMPNHVHAMIETVPSTEPSSHSTLDSIVHSWKSYTAHQADRLLGQAGEFWFREYYDRFIRNEEHYHTCKGYIEANPVKAGFVKEPQLWRWSSAFRLGKSGRIAFADECVADYVADVGSDFAEFDFAESDFAEFDFAGGTPALPGGIRHIHYAPYLDYRPLADGEPTPEEILALPECAWISGEMEQKAQGYGVSRIVPEHLKEVRDRKLALIAKTEAAVHERLTKEITYWDHRAEQLKLQEQAGRPNARLNSGEARKRADILQSRLEKRLKELRLEAQISPLLPVVLGGLLVVPQGLLMQMMGKSSLDENAGGTPALPGTDTQAAAASARAIVMQIEKKLGYEPTDRELEKLGYDIESRVPGTGKLRFIEVKGRISGAQSITVTRNEILYSLNKPEDYILAIVEFFGDGSHHVHYIRQPFHREPDFGVTSVNYDFSELIDRGTRLI